MSLSNKFIRISIYTHFEHSNAKKLSREFLWRDKQKLKDANQINTAFITNHIKLSAKIGSETNYPLDIGNVKLKRRYHYSRNSQPFGWIYCYILFFSICCIYSTVLKQINFLCLYLNCCTFFFLFISVFFSCYNNNISQ